MHALCPNGGAAEAGQSLLDVGIHLVRAAEYRIAVGNIIPVRVARHLRGVFVHERGKIFRHGLELFHADIIVFQAAACHKIVAVIIYSPEHAEARIHRKPRRKQIYHRRVQPLQPPAAAYQLDDRIYYVNQNRDHSQPDKQLRDGKGQMIVQHRERAVHRPHKALRRPDHQRVVIPRQQVQQNQRRADGSNYMSGRAEPVQRAQRRTFFIGSLIHAFIILHRAGAGNSKILNLP